MARATVCLLIAWVVCGIPQAAASDPDCEALQEELVKLTKRNRNLVRANNLRRGMTRADEKPPEDHWKRRFPELEQKLLDEYYKFKGWNNDGVPTRETLLELGLDYIYEDFVERGILKADAAVPAGVGSSEGGAS